MEFIINDRLVIKEQTEESKKCKHVIIRSDRLIKDTKYRYCKKCGMVAHEDGDYSYTCGFDHCRCMQ